MKLPSLLTGAVLAATVLAAAVVPATPAAAHDVLAWEVLYYSNGQLVGRAWQYCDGHSFHWGDLTQLDNEFLYYGCD